MAAKQSEITQERYGEDEQMKVKFREVDPFDLWVSTVYGCHRARPIAAGVVPS